MKEAARSLPELSGHVPRAVSSGKPVSETRGSHPGMWTRARTQALTRLTDGWNHRPRGRPGRGEFGRTSCNLVAFSAPGDNSGLTRQRGQAGSLGSGVNHGCDQTITYFHPSSSFPPAT